MSEKHLYVTIDTEMDADVHWGKKWPPQYSSVIEGIPRLLRPIWDKYDVHPIYFVSPEVLYCDTCCEVLKEEIRKGAIIGAHLHGEYIEPESKWGSDMETFSVPFPCTEYDRRTEEQKIANLTRLIQERLNVCPVWYRAARFGADIDTIRILRELGYRYDSSVTPGICWKGKGGPDHSKSGVHPYIISEDDYYSGELVNELSPESFQSGVIEVPVTICGKRMGTIGRILPDNWLMYNWLRPTHMTLWEMKQLMCGITDESIVVMMFHSMEIMIKKTPYVRSRWMQRYYLFRLDRIIEYAIKKGYVV